MNVLITGVAGLLGSRMADWIIENKPECRVIGVDDLSGGYESNVNENVTFHHTKVESPDLSDIFEKNDIDYVYHFAAYAAEGLSPFIRSFNYQNNLMATANVINNCINHNVKRLVFTSSMAVYGEGTPPFEEGTNRQPVDPYGVAKSACEMDIEIAGQQHKLDWCIVRPHNVYGIKQNIWDKYRNVIGIWMRQHINGNPMTIFGDGTQKRAFSYIDDCLEPLWKAATDDRASKEIINLGGTKEYSIEETCDVLLDIVGDDGSKTFLEKRHEVHEAWSTHQKSVDLLDYKDKTDMRTGLSLMWEWAKKQPNRTPCKFAKYEVDKGIYSYWK